MIQINLIRDRRIEKLAGGKSAGPGLSLSLPKLPFNVGILASVVGMVIILAIIILTVVSQRAKITSLNAKIKNYQEELTKLAGPKRLVDEYLAKQADVNTKLNEIASIDRNRFYTVKLLDQLSYALPSYLWLNMLKDEKGTLSMEGMTFSNLIVADFMDKLKESGYFSEVELTQTSKAVEEDRELVKFTITSKYIDKPVAAATPAASEADQAAGKGPK